MEIEILGTESLGVRGLCCVVKTKSNNILIDPGIALGFLRHGLHPHPFQVAICERIRRSIIKAWHGASDIVFSHFHGDHVPLENANPYQLNIDMVKELNPGATMWAKLSVLSHVEKARSESISYSLGKELISAEGKDTGLMSFFGPVPHGEEENNFENVMITKIKEDFVFVHASDLQLLNEDAVSKVLSLKPDIVLVSGPPLYLSKMSKRLFEIAWFNALRLTENVKTLIIDHHLLRNCEGVRWLERLASKSRNQVLCSADFMKKPRLLLEARRTELYNIMPVPKRWHEDYTAGKVDTSRYWEMGKDYFNLRS